jgi:hypothetical protein
MGDPDLLARAVDELYAVTPAGFVARRRALVAQAREAGDRDAAREIGALRKPTAPADAVNQVVRADHPVVAELRDVAGRLRRAQAALDAAGLAALRGPRDAVVSGFVRAAEEVAGLRSAGGLAEVRDTVIAALADAAAEEVVCSGALTRSLGYSGFGEVDVSDAVARTSTGVLLTRIEGGRDDQEDAGHGGEPDDEAPRDEPHDAPHEEASGEAPDDEPRQEEQDEQEHDDEERDEEHGPPAPDPEVLALARSAVAAAEQEVGRTRSAVDQATRLLDQAQRRAQSAEAAYETALADLAELEPEGG